MARYLRRTEWIRFLPVRRDARMLGQSYTVLRFTNAQVMGNAEEVVAAIRAEVRQLQTLEAHP